MNVEIVERMPTPIAYLRHVGPYGESLGAFWQRTVYPWRVSNGLVGRRYDAGCEIPSASGSLGNAQKTTIPGGKYAQLSFKGTTGEIEQAWISMLRDWRVPCSSIIPRTRATTLRRACSIASSACRSSRCERRWVPRVPCGAGRRLATPSSIATPYSRL
jgi:DNA gyrase inhibitor GyrI